MLEVHLDYASQHTLTPKENVRKHNHVCYELVYYDIGTGNTTFNMSNQIDYAPNTYAIQEPLSFHTETHYLDTHVFCIGFHVDPNYLFIPNSGLHTDTDKFILKTIHQLFEEINEKAEYYYYAADLLLDQILLYHHRALDSSQKRDKSLNNITNYLDENFQQSINYQNLAEMAGYSYDHFRHLFKKTVGVSPNNYVLRKRISYAKQLLEENKHSIAEISYLCGFSSVSEFSVIFKRKVGTSPHKYLLSHCYILENIDTMTLE